ncbi:mannan-binding lectin serine protease 1-like [Asterias amurensis]|uniref:mannan-binding lectin serine protease 1-like n=1 Tax=Asterias amurensis TaxID=7602 RepID=UPI003AB8BC43
MAQTLNRTRVIIASILMCLVHFPVNTTCETEQRSALYGQIESPDYPEPYGNNVDRVWNITVPDGFTIVLYFSLFELEASLDCAYDNVKVSSSEETATFCGNGQFLEFRTPRDRNMTSPNNNMVVEFHSDYSNEEQFSGFVAHYQARDINECLVNNGGCEQVCHNFVSGYYCSCRLYYQLQPDNHHCKVSCRDIVYTSEQDEFQTPDYPDDYPPNADCNWLINVDFGYSINIVFETFQIESHPTVLCPYDFVKIYYDNEVRGPICGDSQSDLPASFSTSGNIANVTFHSDQSVQRMGFRARYDVTGRSCGALYRPTYGMISGSNFTFRDSVRFSCNDGYVINGSTSRSCQANGTWSGIQPTCEIVKCNVPQPISNGEILYYSGMNFSYSNSIRFVCNDYYEMEGISWSECGVNGTWTPEPPVCVPICGESSISPRNPQPGRIVGGQESTPGSWPWQVLINIKAPGFGGLRNTICGGSVLNEEWILTAAHCVTGTEVSLTTYGKVVPNHTVVVSLGIHTRNSPAEHTVVRSALEIIKHAEFDHVTLDYDVALIHLNESIQFNDVIRPICLPPQSTHIEQGDDKHVYIPNVADTDTTAVVIGWGQIQKGRSTSNVLLEVYVGVNVPRNLCNMKLNDPVTTNMVCAGSTEGGLDSCGGDSGGPLMLRDDVTNRYFTYGIVSWGEGCARPDKFGVYVRIENFVDWIQYETFVER